MKGSHMFSWSHEDGDKKTTITIPVSIAKTVDNGNGIPTGKLVCNKDQYPLKQQYKCEKCGESYSIGEIEKRYDEENEVIYDYQEKRRYLASKAENEISIFAEMPLTDVLLNLEFLTDVQEIYTNQNSKTIEIVNKIHKWLYKHKKALLASYGHRGENLVGAIVPGDKKLLLLKFRDHRNIRPPKQKDLEPLENKNREVFEVLSEDKTPDLYDGYIEKIKKGKKISIEESAKIEPELEMTSVEFLDD